MFGEALGGDQKMLLVRMFLRARLKAEAAPRVRSGSVVARGVSAELLANAARLSSKWQSRPTTGPQRISQGESKLPPSLLIEAVRFSRRVRKLHRSRKGGTARRQPITASLGARYKRLPPV